MEQHLVRAEDQEDLHKIQQEKYEAALRNLITGRTPTEAVYQRPARGGMQVDYVPVWWFIEQANALFGYLWDFEVIEQSIGDRQIWVKGRLTVHVPGRTVGELRFDPVSVSKTQFGGSDIKFYKDRPKESIDVADDLKSASSDALKKCFSALGFAADVYGNREVLERTAPNKDQLNIFYKIASDKGMTKDQADGFCKDKHGKNPDELETVLVLGLIQEIRNADSQGS